MSEQTNYEVLGVLESASPEEIKRAYRLLIRQVHPDSVPNASAFWKQAAEEKSKQINEAYHVLSNLDQRASYDVGLFRQRQKVVSTSSKGAAVSPDSYSHQTATAWEGQEQTKFKYQWQTLKRWIGRYPVPAGCLGILVLTALVSISTGLIHRKSSTASYSLNFDGYYSAYPCLEPRATVSPIDGKPCRRSDSAGATAVADVSPVMQHPAQNAARAKAYSRASVTPKWFYMTSDGVRAFDGAPGDDTCSLISAKSSADCRASLRFCPRGVWAKDCVSYSKWEKKIVDPPRPERIIPEWPAR
jgi:curved DNA-binding protein CbpA